jgi:hypothetical protein
MRLRESELCLGPDGLPEEYRRLKDEGLEQGW